MGRRGDAHRLIRWLWTSRRVDARLARLALLPFSAVWRAGTAARNLGFDRGWNTVRELPLPAVAVGNLTVGGSGKTPIASWIAAHYASRGLVPGILLRGYGRDEVLVHRYQVPGARVIADPDRLAGAERALAEGAEVLVLDDAFQRRDVWRDYNIAVMSADASRAVHWSLPAGPWREGLHSLHRADAFVAQTKATGAQVQVATWNDHHEFRDQDLAWLAKAARKADFVVVTQKDAVKLRDRWPASVPEPLVAVLDFTWEHGEAAITAGLDAIVTPVERL